MQHLPLSMCGTANRPNKINPHFGAIFSRYWSNNTYIHINVFRTLFLLLDALVITYSPVACVGYLIISHKKIHSNLKF